MAERKILGLEKFIAEDFCCTVVEAGVLVMFYVLNPTLVALNVFGHLLPVGGTSYASCL